MKGDDLAAVALSAAAAFENSAQAQTDPSLDEVVVTAKSLEDELPQQLSHYGTRVDIISAAKIKDGGYLDVAGALEALEPWALYQPQEWPVRLRADLAAGLANHRCPLAGRRHSHQQSLVCRNDAARYAARGLD